MKPKIHLCFRGWESGVKECAFEERAEVSEGEAAAVLPRLVEKHIELLKGGGMVEIEFLDEPDQNQRFFRIGTDPSRMVQPIAINLRNLQ